MHVCTSNATPPLEGWRQGACDQTLHGDIEFHYSLCFHALQLMRTSSGRSPTVLVFPRIFFSHQLAFFIPKEKNGLSMSL